MLFIEINKLILFGGSRILSDFSYYLAANKNIDFCVFTSQRHLNELKSVFKKNNIRHYISGDINKDENLKKEITENSIGVAFGAAWVFNKHAVSLFKKDYLLDFMGIDLPRYRGGAHYTWQTLHENKKGCANLQIIYGGQETFHKGEIIKRLEYSLPNKLKRPVDYFDFIAKSELNFLKDFLKEVNKGADFKLQRLNESKSSYYPFLSTENNGYINWSWSGKDIYLFINAFDEPYSGATTYLNGKKVYLKDCALLKAEEKYHPFTVGLVIRKSKDGVFIATAGNLLRVNKIFDSWGKNIINLVELGERFVTPQIKLEGSLKFKANYGPGGLVK